VHDEQVLHPEALADLAAPSLSGALCTDEWELFDRAPARPQNFKPVPERTPMTEHLVPAADQRRLAAILLAGFDGETGNDGPADHHSRRNGWVDSGGVGSGKAVSTAGTASAIALLHSS
jgi:hypothetical protein